jgi:hypothetical protein
MDVLGGIIISLMLGIHIYILRTSNKKIGFIKSPKVGPTYCILTVMILKALQVNIIMSIICLILRLIFVLMGMHYQTIILMSIKFYWIYYFYQIVGILLIYTTDIVYVTQIYEWMAMNNIIVCQKGKLIQELYFI